VRSEAQPIGIDKDDQMDSIVPHFIHALDATHLFRTLNALADGGVESVATVHDSIAVHAGRVEFLKETIRKQFFELHTRTLLEDFIAAQIAVLDRLLDQMDESKTDIIRTDVNLEVKRSALGEAKAKLDTIEEHPPRASEPFALDLIKRAEYLFD
jgi:DNA-directed RNA polymerase